MSRLSTPARIALAGLALLAAAVAFGPLLLPADPLKQNLADGLAPPFWMDGAIPGHPLGTDQLGRDLLVRTLAGGRTSLLVGFVAATLACFLGILAGLVAGYLGGIIDRLIMGVGDLWIAFPFLVLAIAAITVVGSSTPVLIVLLTLAGWVTPARVTRALARRLKGEDYVSAAVGFGGGHRYVIARHLLPAVAGANAVIWTFMVGALVLIEGGLSFLGLGVRPPTPSWGTILNDGRDLMETAWWVPLWPGLALTLTVLFVNLLGDGLRRVFDVKESDRA
ncbi:ABC transporter permease [Actinocorallia sp. A-T 12471]|uniref:ABC transporter permease n=1 Tax=Actinocorallia sp. A-T 12471 TaxID=3089813 RepID=UPI0029D080EE|nr:ABC transporter permease [Actinocorallia sp. A-T 12471]MDX6744833.1 ABC transporter permease [Actinocorallia sp. A-T 12471]